MGKRANIRAARYASEASARELARANELHHRAEVQRRAMMTPEQRAEADFVLEVERTRKAGESAASLRAFTIVLVGFVVACMIAVNATGWLFLPIMAGVIWWASVAYKLRMGELNLELSNMVAPWDKKAAE
ncbi:hypothetical protein H7X46_00140 [Pseudonocardia sp. C8]|uniref:hypothetical protein n=1 Tax=Pseudonocardia sp. C8 TaxID=2762759 RepID=UPI00164299C6|nr:hypothetical protein [Pseudonocardia sp. C8]MBC3189479.1 hypothetical protein [Pseudonocardia sp. C8]